MYDKSDPRASLAAAPAANAPKPVTEYFGAQAGLFYEMEPQEKTAKSKTWITRGASMVICYSDVEAGAEFSRDSQVDEYVLLIPEKETTVEVTTEMDGTKKVDGYTCSFLPPGKSKIKVLTKGRIVTMFTPKSKDLADKASNASAYTKPHPTVPPIVQWPDPPGGFKLRTYSPRRDGRARPLRPHLPLHDLHGELPRPAHRPARHHQAVAASPRRLRAVLAVPGRHVHASPALAVDDQHEHLAAGRARHLPTRRRSYMIPPPSIHTSTAEDTGLNQLVDIFVPAALRLLGEAGLGAERKGLSGTDGLSGQVI